MTAHTAAARGLFTQPTTLTHTLPPDRASAKVSVTLTRSTNNKMENKMAGFLTRTKHLDKHVAERVRLRAKRISDEVKRDNKRYAPSDRYGDIDGPPMRELASKFSKHEDTEAISKWLRMQDTAFRDSVPRMVLDIIKENTNC